MLSEIPQIQVVTAILDSDEEDFISQLLFSQGWSVIFRAIDMKNLEKFLHDRSAINRTIVLYKTDLPGWDLETVNKYLGVNSLAISLEGITTNSHDVMEHIRSHLRTPLVHEGRTGAFDKESAAAEVKAPRRIVTITGTSGAPGRSTLAINLAEELSLNDPIDLLDADMKAPSLPYLLRQHASTHPNREGHHPIEILEQDFKDRNLSLDLASSHNPMIVDIGVLPALDELLTDRRWQAALLNKILNETTTLIYLASATGISLIRLEEFMRKFPLMIRKIPIIYILNQSGAARIDKGIESRFLDLVEGEKYIILPTNGVLSKKAEREAMNSLLGLLSEIDRRPERADAGGSRPPR